MKIWNGRDICSDGIRGHIYICAKSKADACRMLHELYPHMSVSQWNREMTIYFSPSCWGNRMEGVPQERGIWLENDADRGTVPVRVFDGREATK